MEGDLHDIGKTVRDITSEAPQNFMKENYIVVGALRVQHQKLQVRTPHAGTLLTSLAIGTTAAEKMLHVWTKNT